MDKVWLDKCLVAAEKLYGAFPFDVLEEMFGSSLDRNEAIKVAEGKLDFINSTLDEFTNLGYDSGYFTPTQYEDGEEFEKYKAQGDRLHISEHEVELLLKEQGPKPFYIPNRVEIEELSKTGMIENSSYKKLKKKVPEIKQVWDSIYNGDEINKVIEKAISVTSQRHEGKPVVDVETFNEVARLIIECHNHTNLRINRGWEPMKLVNASGGIKKPKSITPTSSKLADEMRAIEPEINEMDINVDYNSGFGSFTTTENGKVKKIKVGRNEPCPCGSGKKYKKCHGRTENRIAEEVNTTNTERKENKAKNEAKKPWNSLVLFLPEKMIEQDTEDYYFYGSNESITLSKEKLTDNSSDIVKCNVTRRKDEPYHIAVYNDTLFALSKYFPGRLDVSSDLNGFFGVYFDDDKTIEIHVELKRLQQ